MITDYSSGHKGKPEMILSMNSNYNCLHFKDFLFSSPEWRQNDIPVKIFDKGKNCLVLGKVLE